MDPARPAHGPQPPQRSTPAARPAELGRLPAGAPSSARSAAEQRAVSAQPLPGATRNGADGGGAADCSSAAGGDGGSRHVAKSYRPAAARPHIGLPVRLGQSGGSGRSQAQRGPPAAKGAGTAEDSGRGSAQSERVQSGYVTLEETEIEWDAADVAALKRHALAGSKARSAGASRDSDPHVNGEESAVPGCTRSSGELG